MSRFPLRLVYLDFDGVLHPDRAYRHARHGVRLLPPGQLFEHAEWLVEALRSWPEVALVLSTSWVPTLSFSRAKQRLPQSLQDRVIGATWHSEFRRNWDWRQWWESASRFDTIFQDVLRRRPQSWLAIDDDLEGWDPHFRHHIVATLGETALGAPEAQQELQQRLQDLHRPGLLDLTLPMGGAQPLPKLLPTPSF